MNRQEAEKAIARVDFHLDHEREDDGFSQDVRLLLTLARKALEEPRYVLGEEERGALQSLLGPGGGIVVRDSVPIADLVAALNAALDLEEPFTRAELTKLAFQARLAGAVCEGVSKLESAIPAGPKYLQDAAYWRDLAARLDAMLEAGDKNRVNGDNRPR